MNVCMYVCMYVWTGGHVANLYAVDLEMMIY